MGKKKSINGFKLWEKKCNYQSTATVDVFTCNGIISLKDIIELSHTLDALQGGVSYLSAS